MPEVKLIHRFCAGWAFGSLLLVLGGCSPGTAEYLAGNLNGMNHTSEAINYFSVNGYRGSNIPPHGDGGGACCVLLPSQWQPNLMVTVKWETDPSPRAVLPGVTSQEFPEAYQEHKKGYRTHIATVEIPYYESQTMCSLKIHFLPCHQIKATTACMMYGLPDYPIKEPQTMKEPAVCPK